MSGHPPSSRHADGWSPMRVWRVGRSRSRSHPHRWLRRGLVLAGCLVLVSSAGALTVGGNRIAAEEAAFRAPAAPQCVPSTIDRSDVLPGTSLRVSPLPDSLDASPRTQISLLGVPLDQLSQIAVSGSVSGGHAGRLVGFSQGDGASFLPAHAFLPGEIVTVRGKLQAKGHWQPFAFRFTVSVPDPVPTKPPGNESEGKPGEVQHFHSAPNLNAPTITVAAGATTTAGDIFSAPYTGPGGDGPMITEPDGQLVWFDPLPKGTYSTNLQVQSYEGKPVLTWWQGYIPPQGFGEGEEVIANGSYKQILHVHAGNGFTADLHDFKLGANNTALLTVFNTIRCNLTAIHGPQGGAVTDSLFQEIDLHTGLVRREWDSVDHVPLSDSYASPYGVSLEWPLDFFHLNSVDQEPGGEMLISARNTWSLYELNEQSGQIEAEAGGKHSTIKMGSGTLTAYQHDATLLPDGLVSVFDNGGVPFAHSQSRGILVSLNQQTHTETLVSQFEHPGTGLKAGSQGNVELMPSGNLFLGWGAEPWFSEFTSSGELVYDAHMPSKDESYRTYRFPWTGTPSGAPAIAASGGGKGPVTLYASWNGATEIASWRVLGGSSTKQLTPVASGTRSGFETAIATPGPEAYVQVQALSSSGAVLGTSPAIKG